MDTMMALRAHTRGAPTGGYTDAPPSGSEGPARYCAPAQTQVTWLSRRDTVPA